MFTKQYNLKLCKWKWHKSTRFPLPICLVCPFPFPFWSSMLSASLCAFNRSWRKKKRSTFLPRTNFRFVKLSHLPATSAAASIHLNESTPAYAPAGRLHNNRVVYFRLKLTEYRANVFPERIVPRTWPSHCVTERLGSGKSYLIQVCVCVCRSWCCFAVFATVSFFCARARCDAKPFYRARKSRQTAATTTWAGAKSHIIPAARLRPYVADTDTGPERRFYLPPSRRARSKLLRYRFCILHELFSCRHRCRVGLMLRRARAGLLSCSFLAPYLAASRPHDDGAAFSPLSQRRLLGRCVLRTTVDTVLDRCVGLRCVNIALPSKVAPITRADVSHTLACVIDTGMCVHTHTHTLSPREGCDDVTNVNGSTNGKMCFHPEK